MKTISTPEFLAVFGRKNADGSVSIYRDRKATKHFATFDRYLSNKPTRRNKWVTLNCYRWRLQWLAPETASRKHKAKSIPADWPVQPLAPGENPPGKTTCGNCGRSWDDDKSTSMTPAPAARCPFEPFHAA